jgi:hypothetical protein
MDRLDTIKAFGKLTLNHPHLKVALQRLSLAVTRRLRILLATSAQVISSIASGASYNHLS